MNAFSKRVFHISIFTLLTVTTAALLFSCTADKPDDTLSAGFARAVITPPLGTPMTGFGDRDYDPAGCKGIHDDLWARALWIEHGSEKALIMGFDLLFFSRDEADRMKGAIGRAIDIAPSAILLNTSHTHTGPKVGTWFYTPSDLFYLDYLEQAVVRAAVDARNNARPATLKAGSGKSSVPVSRRKKLPNGVIDFAPAPDAPVCDNLPVCLFEDTAGKPICLLFSISCHPSTVKGVDRSFWISADYPGAAMRILDERIGAPVSLFLQGAGGDSKASVIADPDQWRAGTWDDVEAAGKLAADEVSAMLNSGLATAKPSLRSFSTVMEWPLLKPLPREGYAAIAENPMAHAESMPEVMRAWALEQMAKLDRGYELRSSVPVAAHGICLGEGVRIVGIEGELVAELGNRIAGFYGQGVTFPLGYTDGAQMYLPTSAMLDEGGYEVESYWEYRQPAPLAKGHEAILDRTLARMREMGVR